MALGDTKALGQGFDQIFIGLAIDRWCSDADLQAVGTMRTDDLILTGTRLYPDVQDELIAVPLIPASHFSPGPL